MLNVCMLSSTYLVAQPMDATERNLRACGAGLSGELSSKFNQAVDASRGSVPGRGTLNTNILGTKILDMIGALNSDQSKERVLKMYFDCIKPVVEGSKKN